MQLWMGVPKGSQVRGGAVSSDASHGFAVPTRNSPMRGERQVRSRHRPYAVPSGPPCCPDVSTLNFLTRTGVA
jgi:hypothetical protein